MSNFDQDYTSALFLFSWIVNDELTTEIRPLCQINSFCSSDFTDIIQNFLLYSMRHHIEYLYITTISRQYSVLPGMFDLMDTDRNKVKRDCGRQQHVYYATLCVAQGDCNCWGEGFSLKISVSDSLYGYFWAEKMWSLMFFSSRFTKYSKWHNMHKEVYKDETCTFLYTKVYKGAHRMQWVHEYAKVHKSVNNNCTIDFVLAWRRWSACYSVVHLVEAQMCKWTRLWKT